MDLVGKKIHKLTILSEYKKGTRIYCVCQCDCGKIKEIRKDNVGKTMSCGCLHSPNMTGQRFGRLVVIGSNKSNKICRCDCGNICEVQTNKLKSGWTQSCGCLKKERQSAINGLYNTRLHKIWVSMHTRCECKKHKSYKTYKDKPICEKWHSLPNRVKQTGFLAFYEWAIKNGYKDNLTLDRIDNDKGYCPENCRWVTIKEQARNTTQNIWIEYRGERKILCEWCEKLGLSPTRIQHTVERHGLTYAEAFDRHLYYQYNPHTWTWEKKEDKER